MATHFDQQIAEYERDLRARNPTWSDEEIAQTINGCRRRGSVPAPRPTPYAASMTNLDQEPERIARSTPDDYGSLGRGGGIRRDSLPRGTVVKVLAGGVVAIAAAFGISYAAYALDDSGSGGSSSYTPSSGSSQSCRTMSTDGPCTSDNGLRVDSSAGYQEGVELARELAGR
jgi:hypothetical protein